MRILHTMIRVGDLDKSLAFYTDILGMRLLRRNDYPDGKFTLEFAECLGACEGAPCALVDEDCHMTLDVDSASKLIDGLK